MLFIINSNPRHPPAPGRERRGDTICRFYDDFRPRTSTSAFVFGLFFFGTEMINLVITQISAG